MGRIQFNQDVTTDDRPPRTFKKGQVVDFAAEFSKERGANADPDRLRERAEQAARRFVSEGLALDLDAPPVEEDDEEDDEDQ